LLGFLTYGSIALLGVIAMEFTSISFSGTSHAIASLAANIGAIVAGFPFSMISKYYTWRTGFKCIEVVSILVLIFLFLFRNAKSKFIPIPMSRKNQ
jgi:MFS transporter, OPA family, solute carrier family 37 (glycerol-6-phosphate transporter), member 4